MHHAAELPSLPALGNAGDLVFCSAYSRLQLTSHQV